MSKQSLSVSLTAGLSLLFPAICFCCQKKINQGYLCKSCQGKISFLKPPACYHNYAYRSNRPGRQGQIISSTAYQEPITSLVHWFKYRHCRYLGTYLSSLIINHLAKVGFSSTSYDFITAVPMHRHKLKLRGYNQAEVLALDLSNYFKIPLRNDIISITGLKPSQTKLAQNQREGNVAGIFKVDKSVKNLNCLLVDDIFTTGATIFSCWQALTDSGINTITALTLAKTINNKLK